MVLSDDQIINYNTKLVDPLIEQNVSPVSVDLTLGNKIGLEDGTEVDITDGYDMRPGEFLLAYTTETVRVPLDLVGIVKGKSSRAREGLMVECAGLCDSGWSGQVVLEMKNLNQHRTIQLKPGMKICQIMFMAVLGEVSKPYSSANGHHYQNQTGVTRSWQDGN